MEWLIAFIALAIVFCVISIVYAVTNFHTVYYRLSSEQISKPVKFVLLSDLHDKSFGKENEKLIEAIADENPDAILIAGDMLTASLKRDAKVAERLCEALASKYPIYYGLGNHEAKMKWNLSYYKDTYFNYMDAMRKAGVHMLIDGSITLADEAIRISGLDLERTYYKRGVKTTLSDDYVAQKLGTKEDKFYHILLAHNPEYFDAYEQWGADLVLSGHVHGGLIRLPFLGGVIAPSLKLFPKYDGGLFYKNNTTMILSRGLAFHNLGLRMWNQGELVVIELLPTKE